MTSLRTAPSGRLMTYALLASIALSSPLPVAAQPPGDGPPTYYELEKDGNSLQLLDLGGFAGSGENTTLITIDLFRGEQKLGFRAKWRVDCTRLRMTIIEMTPFAPGEEGRPGMMPPDYVMRDDSAKAERLYDLACDREGDLETRRTHFDELATIVARFWR